MNDISKVSPYRIDGFFETKTNCITKIPQDIKLELSVDGVLTLKAGSKIYYIDGSSYEIPSDISEPQMSTISGDCFAWLNEDKNKIQFFEKDGCFSGNSEEQIKIVREGSSFFFNTETNLVYYKVGANNTPIEEWEVLNKSLPFACVTTLESKITQINQVFNGFGYVGNTIFALPGIEGLIPNGRNANNEIINKTFITNKLLMTTNSGSTDTRNIILSDTICDHPELSGYDDINNIIWRDNFEHTDYYHIDCMFCCQVSYTNGRVTSFNPKNVFQAVDRNEIIGWYMPSEKYIDLEPFSLTGEGNVNSYKYEAPSDGFISVAMSGVKESWGNIESPTGKITYSFDRYSADARIFAPISKGWKFYVRGSGGQTSNKQQFIYPKGNN